MALDGSKLQVSVEDGSRWRRTLQVTVPSDIVEGERNRAARELAARLKLPGFRKGRIPASVVERRFGRALDGEAMEKLIGEAYRAALDEISLNPISEGEVGDVQYEAGTDLVFSISFDVAPEFELDRIGGFAVERPAASVEEGEVDRVLERLREQNGRWEPLEEGKPTPGDLVEVSVLRLDGEEEAEPQEYQFVLGGGDAIPDVEAAIQTLSLGEQGEFTVRFPEDFPAEDRRGDSEELRIHLQGVRTRALPELTDAFAAEMGDFESLADLRSRIQEDLQKEAERQAESGVRSRLLDLILDANPFEVPASMTARYLDSVLGDAQGLDDEKKAELRQSLQPEAERAVRRILVIDAVADRHTLRATDEEIDARVEEIAEKNDTTPSEVYARLQKQGQLDSLEREITENKVFDFLKSQSEITEATP